MMWRAMLTWWNEWNDELLGVLLEPVRANQITIAWRHRIALRLTKLSEIERSQLHQFCLEYYGKKLWFSIVKLCSVFSSLGIVLYLVKPQLHWMLAVMVTNLLGWMLIFALIGIWFNYRQIVHCRFRTSLWSLVGILLGYFVSTTISAIIQSKNVLTTVWHDGPLIIVVAGVIGGIYVILVGIVARWRNNEYKLISAQMALMAERSRFARLEIDAQLGLLRSQIEPHFLFNALGAVQQMSSQGSPEAAELTANLIAFLRANMNATRSEKISLHEEFSLIQAYLVVMNSRMGERLKFQLQLPENLYSIEVPNMMLLTLVEDAIQHGIEPAVRGGNINVEVKQLGQEIFIEVITTGVGINDTNCLRLSI